MKILCALSASQLSPRSNTMFLDGYYLLAWQQSQGVNRNTVAPDLKMKQRLPAAILPHLRQQLAPADSIAFLDQQFSIVAVGTEIILVVFYDDETTIPYQTTACIDHFTALRSHHLLSAAAAYLYPLPARVVTLEALHHLAGRRPFPAQLCRTGYISSVLSLRPESSPKTIVTKSPGKF